MWLSWWADETEETVPSGLHGRDNVFWTWSLGVWVVATIVVAFARAVWSVHIVLRASDATHGRVLGRVLGAPLLYFQQNPPGRLLNRFSSDLHRVDMLVPDRLFNFLDNGFILVSAMLLAVASVPWLLVLLLPALAAGYWIQAVFRATSRQLLRCVQGDGRRRV